VELGKKEEGVGFWAPPKGVTGERLIVLCHLSRGWKEKNQEEVPPWGNGGRNASFPRGVCNGCVLTSLRGVLENKPSQKNFFFLYKEGGKGGDSKGGWFQKEGNESVNLNIPKKGRVKN